MLLACGFNCLIFVCLFQFFPKWFFLTCILSRVSKSAHNSKISFSSSSWFSFFNIIFKMLLCFVNSLAQPTCVARDHHQKSVRARRTFSLPITFFAFLLFYLSLWIRATISICLLTRTKFDYLKIPNSAASATRARGRVCFIIDFFAIIDSWKLITKTNRYECVCVALLNFIKQPMHHSNHFFCFFFVLIHLLCGFEISGIFFWFPSFSTSILFLHLIKLLN